MNVAMLTGWQSAKGCVGNPGSFTQEAPFLHVSRIADALEADVPMKQALYRFIKQLAEMLYTDQAVKLVRVLYSEAARFPQRAEIFDRAGPQRAHALLAEYFKLQIRKSHMLSVDPLTAADHLIHMSLGEAFRRVLLGLASSSSPKDVERRVNAALKVFMRAFAA